MSAVDVLIRGVKKEVNNIVSFFTTPKGPFETIDQLVKDARRTARELVETTAGGRTPLKLLRGKIRRWD